MLTRRQLLRLGGASLSLPFLPMFRSTARAQPVVGGPKRLIIFHTPQGTVLRQWLPTGGPQNFALPYISAPLADFRDRLMFISGIDNMMPSYNDTGNEHINSNYTVLTGRPILDPQAAFFSPSGPSIEQLISQRLAARTPFDRLDFAVGGPQTRSGLITPHEGSYFWYGPRDPVAMFNDPLTAVTRIFGEDGLSPETIRARRARRASVLGDVLANFECLGSRLPPEDRIRLEGHQEKLRQLEARILGEFDECRAPVIAPQPGYRPGIDDHISAPIFNEILTTALACDLTRVATYTFANVQSPEFPWLWSRNGDRPIVNHDVWESWHSMVHADYQPGMEHPFRWYHEVFADLLGRLATTEDADGDNLLDTSLVVLMTEYSSGRHWNNSLPFVLAGNVPGAQMGRWLNFMDGGIDAFEASNGERYSGTTTNQLWTSVLRAFGQDDETFGLVDDALPSGPLPLIGE